MALSAISDGLTTDTGTRPAWHRWFNSATGRWWSARTTPLKDPTVGSMIVSAVSYSDLMTAEDNSSLHLVGM